MYLNRLGLPSTYFTPVYLTTNYPSFLSLPPPLPPLLLLLLLLPPVPALSLPTTTTTTLASRPQRYRPSPAAVNKMSSSGIFQIDMPSSFAPPVVSISTPRPADNPLFCVDTFLDLVLATLPASLPFAHTGPPPNLYTDLPCPLSRSSEVPVQSLPPIAKPARARPPARLRRPHPPMGHSTRSRLSCTCPTHLLLQRRRAEERLLRRQRQRVRLIVHPRR